MWNILLTNSRFDGLFKVEYETFCHFSPDLGVLMQDCENWPVFRFLLAAAAPVCWFHSQLLGAADSYECRRVFSYQCDAVTLSHSSRSSSLCDAAS